MAPENYVTAVQAAELLGRGIRIVAKLCQDGRLTGAEKVGNAWLIPRASVLNYQPGKRGVKPGTQTKKAKLAAERAAILERAALDGEIQKAVDAFTVQPAEAVPVDVGNVANAQNKVDPQVHSAKGGAAKRTKTPAKAEEE